MQLYAMQTNESQIARNRWLDKKMDAILVLLFLEFKKKGIVGSDRIERRPLKYLKRF